MVWRHAPALPYLGLHRVACGLVGATHGRWLLPLDHTFAARVLFFFFFFFTRRKEKEFATLFFHSEHEAQLSTWAPEGNVRSQLRSFYIGGGPRLKDDAFVGLPVDGNDPVLNKYGMRTTSGGVLEVRLNTIVTTHEAPEPRASARRTQELVESQLQQSLTLVLGGGGLIRAGAGASARR